MTFLIFLCWFVVFVKQASTLSSPYTVTEMRRTASSVNAERGGELYRSLHTYQGLEPHGEEQPYYEELQETAQLHKPRERQLSEIFSPTCDVDVKSHPVGLLFLSVTAICWPKSAKHLNFKTIKA